MKDTTLISVNWNQKEVMELMLKSFVKNHYEGEPLFLRLWENGSDDGSKEWLRENEIPFIDYPRNMGHENAVSLMYPIIPTKYALLVDTDVEFMTNVYDAYLPYFRGSVKIAGELLTNDRLNEKVKPRIGAWFILWDYEAIWESGITKFRDTEAWDYDVASHFTEQVFEKGFTHHQIDRLNADIDRDVIGMDYGTHRHYGKVSWNVANHMDRESEIQMRLAYIKERLKEYRDVELKGIFV